MKMSRTLSASRLLLACMFDEVDVKTGTLVMFTSRESRHQRETKKQREKFISHCSHGEMNQPTCEVCGKPSMDGGCLVSDVYSAYLA
jgi:hypothetical protein